MRAHLQTSWAKTQHSHAPLALHLTSTTYAQTSLKTTGSMVHTCLHISTLTRWVHSKRVIAFPPNFRLFTDTKSLSVPSGWLLAFHCRRKQPTYSFSWNFYMNAIAEQGPHLQGNLQCATKFTVLVTQPHSHTHNTCTHTRTHTDTRACTVITEEGVFSLCVYISSLKCFTATDGLSCINSCHQDLNPYTWAPHFTTTQSEMFGVIMSVSVSQCVYTACVGAGQAERKSTSFLAVFLSL